GYDEEAIKRLVEYAVGRGTLAGAPGINHGTLAARGFTAEKIEAGEEVGVWAFDIKFVFNKWNLGEEFCTNVLGLAPERLDHPGFALLAVTGLLQAYIKTPDTQSL